MRHTNNGLDPCLVAQPTLGVDEEDVESLAQQATKRGCAVRQERSIITAFFGDESWPSAPYSFDRFSRVKQEEDFKLPATSWRRRNLTYSRPIE
jgi:hypothetical protein